ncbi:hypothetical protein [Pseudogemmobacter sonorensis]|uniref:hypothetical protein n=1 Tax=Pseudogemmobacter sonorensis TaxID=2989681 RepID=UPI0036B9C753
MATWAQRLIREKIQLDPDTPIATTAADAILARNVTMRFLDAEYQQRDFVTGIEGAQGEDLSNVRAGAEYEVEAAFAAAPETPPHYAHLIRSSGWDMTDDDGDIVFTPMDPGDTIPACTLMMKNGALQQVIGGLRGSLAFTAEVGRKPFFRFNRLGRYQPPSAYVKETHDFSGWPRALDCIPENMFAFTLGGTKLCCRSFNFTDGRSPVVDKYMNCEGTTLGPRRMTGRMTVKWPTLAAKDLLTQIRTGVTEAVTWTLGSAAASLAITGPKVQIKWAGEQDIEGDLGINLDLVFEPLAGNDEIGMRFIQPEP